MTSRLRIWVSILVVMMVMLSCNLPQANSGGSPTGAVPPAESPARPEQTSAPRDLSPARLNQSDLPAGFEPLSEQELADLGFSINGLLDGLTSNFSNASPQNFAAYIHTAGYEVVISTLVSPLTVLERAAFDIYLSDPQRVLADIGQGTGAQIELVNSAGQIGSSSVVVDAQIEGGPFALDGGGVISRRGEAVQVTLHFYLSGATPAVTAAQVAQAIDSKLEAILR